jgi:Domain of unknown function (DUF4352)
MFTSERPTLDGVSVSNVEYQPGAAPRDWMRSVPSEVGPVWWPEATMKRLRAALTVAAIMIVGWAVTSGSAQPAPWRLVQGADGVLFVIRGDVKHRIVPAPMTEADMAIPEAPAWEDGVMLVLPTERAASQPPNQTAAPPQSGGKRIGDTTVLTAPSGLRLAVTANAFEDAASSSNPRRVPDGRWAVVDWTVKNEGSTEVNVNRLNFKLQTTDGHLIERSALGIREPDLETERLGPGQIARGWLTYDVPAGLTIKSLVYQPAGAPQFVIAEV